MLRKIKKAISFMFSRLFLVALMIIVQIAVIFLLVFYASAEAYYFYIGFHVISFIMVIAIVSNNENPIYKLTWAIAILLLPLTGGLFYLLLGNKRIPPHLREQTWGILDETKRHMPGNILCGEELSELPHLGRYSRYIYNLSGYPLYTNTVGEYFALGDTMFEKMLEELRKAERFIFLEYFIVCPGYMWNTILEVLQDRLAAGVEIRFLYDDLGSIGTRPKGFDKMLRQKGFQVCVFNPFRPRLSMIMNYRDHRKVCVIDGRVAFCGGINIADEYINHHERFGHWKDTGVMLSGEAVWSFTFMFLQMWRFSCGEEIDYPAYHANIAPPLGQDLVQVFGDTPLDSHNVTEVVYMNIISRATRYVYITTPYLVIDNEMEVALCSAAQSGIDVRIITPSIYDKWYVHILTRSHYAQLIRAGVKIYEYTPGFMHGKMFVADDEICMVGTCNMDFRSFYLHFECTVAFFDSPVIQAVKQDMLACQQASYIVSLEETKAISVPKRILRAFLKMFAPLM